MDGACGCAVAAHGAARGIPFGHLHLHALGKLGVLGHCGNHELALLQQNPAAAVGRLRSHGLLQRLLQLRELVRVVLNALGHCRGTSQRLVALGDDARARRGNAAHKLAALVGTGLLMVEGRLLHLKANGLSRPLLRLRDGIGIGLFPRGRAAPVANAQRQEHAYVAVVRKEREPQLLGHEAHARQQNLVGLGVALEGARAGDVALLVGAGRTGNLVVQDLGAVARGEDLRGAHANTQTTAATVVGDLDRRALDGDCIGGADRQAAVAGVRVLGRDVDAVQGVGARALLVVLRVEDLAVGLLAHQAAGKGVLDAIRGMRDGIPVVLDVYEIIEKVALLGHGHLSVLTANLNCSAGGRMFPPQRDTWSLTPNVSPSASHKERAPQVRGPRKCIGWRLRLSRRHPGRPGRQRRRWPPRWWCPWAHRRRWPR